MAQSDDHAPLNHVACPRCGKFVDDRAVGCPNCGEKIYVEHPADITPTKHPPVQYPDETKRSGRNPPQM